MKTETKIPNSFAPNKNYGYSLIEILIALVLGVMVTVGVFQIYISNKQSFHLTENQSRLQENARFALHFLTEDIRLAGYLGCASRGVTASNSLVTPTNFLYDINTPLEGSDWDAATSDWLPALDANIDNPAINSDDPAENSDIITIRRAETNSIDITLHPNSTSNLTLAGTGTPALANCDLAIASDCDAATVFQVSTFDTGTLVATHVVGGACVPGNSTTSLNESYAGGEIRPYRISTYLIRNFTNALGIDVPTLYRIEDGGNATPLVEGIERMQILYGVDSTGDGAANQYVSANPEPNWNQIVSVRITLLVQSIDDEVLSQDEAAYQFNDEDVPVADARLRRQFTTTIALRNLLQ